MHRCEIRVALQGGRAAKKIEFRKIQFRPAQLYVCVAFRHPNQLCDSATILVSQTALNFSEPISAHRSPWWYPISGGYAAKEHWCLPRYRQAISSSWYHHAAFTQYLCMDPITGSESQVLHSPTAFFRTDPYCIFEDQWQSEWCFLRASICQFPTSAARWVALSPVTCGCKES